MSATGADQKMSPATQAACARAWRNSTCGIGVGTFCQMRSRGSGAPRTTHLPARERSTCWASTACATDFSVRKPVEATARPMVTSSKICTAPRACCPKPHASDEGFEELSRGNKVSPAGATSLCSSSRAGCGNARSRRRWMFELAFGRTQECTLPSPKSCSKKLRTAASVLSSGGINSTITERRACTASAPPEDSPRTARAKCLLRRSRK
mmetsp:Transcript_65141/g.202064  ORF Transcript_65141/g.202064 Transcript_65141/m.202064 type:complete len:210 (+) Transcript_65141:913-1542(+)